MREGFGFRVTASDGDARCARLTTPHGVVETPAFMPVATYGAVRGVAPEELRAAGAQILLANTYHLYERPGDELVAKLGGLHGFTGWRGPWLTDSGGYQVMSLADRARIDEEGVTFASPVDGERRQLTPELAVQIQERLGADLAMALDECPPGQAAGGGDGLRAQAAAERTLRWAEALPRAHSRAVRRYSGSCGRHQRGVRRPAPPGPLASASRPATAARTGEESARASRFGGAAHGGSQRRPPAIWGSAPAGLVAATEPGWISSLCLPTRQPGRRAHTSRVWRLRNAASGTTPASRSAAMPRLRAHSRAYTTTAARPRGAGARLASSNMRFTWACRRPRAIAAGGFASLRRRVETLAAD